MAFIAPEKEYMSPGQAGARISRNQGIQIPGSGPAGKRNGEAPALATASVAARITSSAAA